MTGIFSTQSLLKRLSERQLTIGTIVDIGASDGKWTTWCHDVFPRAAFLAIEPLVEHQAALETLASTLEHFHYSSTVAGARDGQEVVLNVTPDLDGSTVNGQNAGSSRTCTTATLDTLLARHNLPGPYFLKFDTHGYELPILEGAAKTLENCVAILMEVHNFQLTPDSLRFPDMCRHLEGLGFRPADIAQPMLRAHDHAFWQFDILFLRSDHVTFTYPHYQ